MKYIYLSFLIFALAGIFFVPYAFAQDAPENRQDIVRAEVLEVLSESLNQEVPGLDVTTNIQEIRVSILEGEQAGEVITFRNDFILLNEGDIFYLNIYTDFDGTIIYSVNDLDRKKPLILLGALFFLVVVIFTGFQGVRAILSLFASFFVILYLLLPQLLAGAPPVITSILFALLILIIVMVVTHGFNRRVLAGLLGTGGSIIVTGILAKYSIVITGLSGFTSDESTYLNIVTRGELDLAGLLLGAIIIGVLGLLDDVAMTQVQVVSELKNTNKKFSRREIYRRAMRVGKEHIGALINTLSLAYAGAALPLLLLFATSDASVGFIINREIFATEIVRTIVGSIGLILTVPLTTLLAIYIVNEEEEGDHHH